MGQILSITALVVFVGAYVCMPTGTTYGSPANATLSNMRQLAVSIAMYANDWDDTSPLAFGQDRERNYSWNKGMLFPDDWAKATNKDVIDRERASKVSWANALMPYSKNNLIYQICKAPHQRLGSTEGFVDQRSTSTEKLPPVGFTYNGLVQALKTTEVTRPDKCPLLWEGLGQINLDGVALSSPTLVCPEPGAPCRYKKSSSSCSNKGNGQTSVLMATIGPFLNKSHGQPIAFIDSHCRQVKLAETSGYTDSTRDPYSEYDQHGNPTTFWYDGCHPWLFRPDYDHVK